MCCLCHVLWFVRVTVTGCLQFCQFHRGGWQFWSMFGRTSLIYYTLPLNYLIRMIVPCSVIAYFISASWSIRIFEHILFGYNGTDTMVCCTLSISRRISSVRYMEQLSKSIQLLISRMSSLRKITSAVELFRNNTRNS